ncbi:transglutaminase domain-containing protein, partial [Methanobacterium formicicum]
SSSSSSSSTSSSSSSSKAAYGTSKTYSGKSYSSSYRSSSSGWSSGKGVGDCWDNSNALYSQLTASGQKARIVQYANSYVSNHRSVEVWNGNSWVDYDYKGNGYSNRYYATSHGSSSTVIASS